MKTENVILGTWLFWLIAAFLCVASPSEGAEKDSPTVSEGKLVRVHYTLTVEGKVLDSSKDKDPLEFQVGSRRVIPGFEKALMGMGEGEKKTFRIGPEEGYGLEDPGGVKEVARSALPPDIELKEGMVLYARGDDGQNYPVRVAEVKKDTVVLDFNHPLAGKTLNFDVEIVEIK
jgi:FKBP-type peptidyl-prolyl cis-trans isomerase SlyD